MMTETLHSRTKDEFKRNKRKRNMTKTQQRKTGCLSCNNLNKKS